MNELRAHPVRLLSILTAGLAAFTVAFAAGSYGDDATPPASAPSASAPGDVTGPETQPGTATAAAAEAPSGSSGPVGLPATADAGDGGTAPAPHPTGQQPVKQPVQRDEPAPAEATREPEPAPATSTLVVTPPQRTCGPQHDNTCE
jgi:hypothetical protein